MLMYSTNRLFQIGIYSFEEIIGYQIYAKELSLKVQKIEKNMPFSIITIVLLGEH